MTILAGTKGATTLLHGAALALITLTGFGGLRQSFWRGNGNDRLLLDDTDDSGRYGWRNL